MKKSDVGALNVVRDHEIKNWIFSGFYYSFNFPLSNSVLAISEGFFVAMVALM